MKTLFDRITSRENLYLAFDTALANLKPQKRARHTNKRDKIVSQLHKEMRDFTWRMNFSNPFIVRDSGKDREIICCSFKDRVAQQAILLQCEPIFSKCMIANSYQAQKGKGIHKANRKIKAWIKELSKLGNVYYLHLDIRKYYQSIKPDIMLKVLGQKIKCSDTLRLFEIVMAGDSKGRGKGITLGNNISQWLGNMYLYDQDHIFSSYNAKYLRYADDMIFLSNDKPLLHSLRRRIRCILHQLRGLSFSKSKIGMIGLRSFLDTLGYKFYINKIKVRDHIKHKLSKAMAKLNFISMPSYLGHCKWGDTLRMVYNMRKHYRIIYGTNA